MDFELLNLRVEVGVTTRVVRRMRAGRPCYQTKLGSTHLCAVKPVYCHQVVVKGSSVFIASAKKEERAAHAQKTRTT